jgi:tetratricopeptide (TPR) repeat protein
MQPAYIRLIVWVILFVPVLVLLGPLWLVPFWLMVFWAYSRPMEKVFGAIFFFVFIFAYPALKSGLQLAAAPTDPSVSFYANAISEGPSPRAIRDLQQYISEHPDDTDASIMLAYLYKLDHAYQSSIDVLQKHILQHPNDARAYNNLAGIYYRQGETDLALRLLQKATTLDGRNALYKYNLSNIYRAKFNFTEAQSLMIQARNSDPSLVKDLEEESHEVMSDAFGDEDLVWQRLSRNNGKWADLFNNPFSIWAGSLFLSAVVLYLSPQRRRQLARQCIKCGSPFCKKCHPILKGYGFCTQCLHIFVKKDGVSPASRKEKMNQIEKYSARQKIISQLTSLVLPGFGILYQNKTTFGVLILLVWLFLIAVLLFTWKFAPHIYLETSDSLKIVALVCTVLMGVLYLLANLPVHRRSRV